MYAVCLFLLPINVYFLIVAIFKVEHARSKESYFATRIFLIMFGPTTRDNNLIRLIISRCEIDLENIKNYYQIIYGRSLASDVSVSIKLNLPSCTVLSFSLQYALIAI